MNVQYDLTQPRVTIRPIGGDIDREREIGQGATMNEAMFFLTIGYTVHVSAWNGRYFEPQCNFFPSDLE